MNNSTATLVTIDGSQYKYGRFDFLFRLSSNGQWLRSSFDEAIINKAWMDEYFNLMERPTLPNKKASEEEKEEYRSNIKKLKKEHLKLISNVIKTKSWKHVLPDNAKEKEIILRRADK